MASIPIHGGLDARLEPAIDPVPADYPIQQFHRDSWHYSAPTFDDDGWSHPRQTASRPDGVDGRQLWGRYRVVIAGDDRTHFRGMRIEVARWSRGEFGPRACTLRMPQISPFEAPGTEDCAPWLHDDARVHLRKVKKNDDGDDILDPDWHWCGLVQNRRGVFGPDGFAVEVEVRGFLYQGDNAMNRPTRPAGPMGSHDIGHRVPHRFNRIIGRRFARIPYRDTGISQWRKGALADSVITFTSQLLSLAWTNAGLRWRLTDRLGRPWQAHLVLPEPDTIDYTLALGTPGVTVDVEEAPDDQANVVYGEWVNQDGGRTQNLKYPNLRPDDAPAYPLGGGATFDPGDSTSGFGKFARWLERNGYKIYSDDTYDARDQDEVEDAQNRMGVAATGIVDATTWGTAFSTGSPGGDFDDAIYLPIAWDKRVERYLYSPDGQRIGRNPDFDPKIARRETYINFGESQRREDVKEAARQIVERSKGLTLLGTITTTADPEECSFRDMREGKMLAVPWLWGHGSGGVKFHIADIEVVEDGDGRATLTVDTDFRDAWTVAQIRERNRDSRDNMARHPRRGASDLTSDTLQPFDADNGAGKIWPHAVSGGSWRVVPMAAAAWGDFVRIRMTTDSPTEFALMLFSRRVTSNFCGRMVGDPLDSNHPYRENAAALKDAGLIQAWGSKEQPCGYSKRDSADGYKSDDNDLTGRFEWDSTVHYWSEKAPRIYLAEWAADDTEFEGRFYNQPVDF